MNNLSHLNEIPFNEGPNNSKIYTFGSMMSRDRIADILLCCIRESNVGINFLDQISLDLAKQIQETIQPKILDFSGGYYFDIEMLSIFKDCTMLTLANPSAIKSPIDLSWFPKLTNYGGYNFDNAINLHQTKVKECIIGSYKNAKTIADLNLPNTVEKLTIASCPLKSLAGIEYLQNLKSIELINLRSVDDLQILSKLPKLTEIRLQLMPKIQSKSFPALPNLQVLNLINSKIDAVDFLKEMPNLNYLNLGLTKIENNDFSPINQSKNWEYLYFKGKK